VEGFLSLLLRLWVRCLCLALVLGLLAGVAAADNSPISLDTSETLFAVLAAMNNCGYDQSLTSSDAMRSNIRAEVQKNLQASEEAQATSVALCDYYQAHRGRDSAHDLSQYISLALYMQGPPQFLPRVKAEEIPPDAALITAFGAVLEHFYDKARLHEIWEKHRADYAALAERYHTPLAKMVFDTEIYLKLASAGYLGRTFTIYLDFLGDPNQVNARNYGLDYYVVVFPAPVGSAGDSPSSDLASTDLASAGPASGNPGSSSPLKMDQIRHTYLHYLMDPLAEKHFSSIKRLEPLLQSVRRAPLDDNFKTDISLLVTECLIRAIEIRLSGNKQTAEAMRSQAVDDADRQGYILTRHFYDALLKFEKDPSGIRSAYSDMLDNIDVRNEEKTAALLQFTAGAAPELLQMSRVQEDRQTLVTAEKRLHAGDTKGAQELAQEALTKKIGDPGRALFILAEVAVANKDIAGARENFQKAIQEAKDPKVIGWSHVYLGRILDLKEDRDGAIGEYRAALTSGTELPEIKAAAERGIAQPYAPPAKPQQ
jgi:tetratricopeptide (TPR) repeat protein